MNARYLKTMLVALLCSLLARVPAHGAPIFGDPSFEAVTGGGVSDGRGNVTYPMDPAFHAAVGNAGGSLSAMSPGKWLRAVTDPAQGAVLRWFGVESTNDYNNYTVPAPIPAGVSGSYFMTGSRDVNQYRSFMQYVQDDSNTVGQLTATIDLWVRELNPDDVAEGGGEVAFRLIAFDNPATMNFNPGDQTGDALAGSTEYLSSTNAYAFYGATAVDVGFETISATLDLDRGYKYLGVVISNVGFDDARGASGETSSFDTLQVGDPVLPPPQGTVLFVR